MKCAALRQLFSYQPCCNVFLNQWNVVIAESDRLDFALPYIMKY